MKYSMLLLILLLIVSNTGCIGLTNKVEKMHISKEEAIEIANKELLKQDFDVTQKNVSADKENTAWNRHFLSDETAIENNLHIVESLKDKNYWAIYYQPKERRFLGGEAWVFVDKNTGEIILLFYAK